MINIAIDGPAGSGKSTVAKFIAKKMDILHLDTGAMYRACALKSLKMGIDSLDEKGVESFINDIDLKIEYENGVQKTILDGIDVSTEIRKNEVSMMASSISSLASVRAKMVDMQRVVASENDCILDGRDIGTNVLPNAKFKFFITASAEIRAERRYKELIERGQQVNYDKLLAEIVERDYNDSHRAIAPLKQADDAVFIDTTNMTIEEVVKKVMSVLEG